MQCGGREHERDEEEHVPRGVGEEAREAQHAAVDREHEEEAAEVRQQLHRVPRLYERLRALALRLRPHGVDHRRRERTREQEPRDDEPSAEQGEAMRSEVFATSEHARTGAGTSIAAARGDCPRKGCREEGVEHRPAGRTTGFRWAGGGGWGHPWS